MKKKSFDAAGAPLPRNSVPNHSNLISNVGSPSQQTVVVVQQPPMISSKSTAEVTLNMLNASENEVDVEGLNFDSTNDVINA